MKSTKTSVLARIRAKGRGWVFSARDFLDFGSRSAVDQTLSRLASEGTIRRIAYGIYDYPRMNKRLGVLAPNPDDIAAALAAKTPGSRIQISGSRAANLLGLTEQVPAQLIYLTDGPSRQIRLGSQIIQLKRTAASKFPGAGTPAGLALQAIRALGPSVDKNFVVRQLSRALSPSDKDMLSRFSKYAPSWSHEIIKQLKEQ